MTVGVDGCLLISSEEVDWETVAKEIQTCHYVEELVYQILPPSTSHQEQPQVTRYVDGQQEVDLTNEIDSLEDQFSEPESEVISNLDKPTKQEIREICTELKRLRINPEPCLGVVNSYWDNVQFTSLVSKRQLVKGGVIILQGCLSIAVRAVPRQKVL